MSRKTYPPRPHLGHGQLPNVGFSRHGRSQQSTKQLRRYLLFSMGLPSVRHSPLPLQSFLPLVVPQPPLPLQEFLPLQACFSFLLFEAFLPLSLALLPVVPPP